MTKYLISFPGTAMVVPESEMADVAAAARAVITEAKQAGVFVFAGGLNEDVAPVVVSAEGSVSHGSYPETEGLSGGFAVFDLASRDTALEWARRLAVACRCAQEIREFQFDPHV